MKNRAQKMVPNIKCKDLPKTGVKHIQSMSGNFLYYARALDFTMLSALKDICTTQSNKTHHTLEEYQQLMNYADTYANVTIP